jgi:hypothetical protein
MCRQHEKTPGLHISFFFSELRLPTHTLDSQQILQRAKSTFIYPARQRAAQLRGDSLANFSVNLFKVPCLAMAVLDGD